MPRPGALREDEGVFAPPALRGCAGERAGKQVRKSPAAIGNAAWMRFLEVFSPEKLGRSSARVGSLAPRTSSPAARVSRSHPGGGSPPGSAPSPPTRARGKPIPGFPLLSCSLNGRLRSQTPDLSYICSSSSSIFTPRLPASRACAPGSFWGCKGGTAKRCKSQNSLWGTGASAGTGGTGRQPCWAPSPVGLASRPKEGEKNPF